MGITQKHHKVSKLWMKKSYKDHTSRKGLQIICFNRHWKLKACTKAFMLVQIVDFYFKTTYCHSMFVNVQWGH
jgi:hypothetical protein